MQAIPRLALLVAVVCAASSPAAAALTAVPSFGANPGALAMYEYVPAGLASNRPLVVVLHGCTQTAAAMEAAGWNELADTEQFAVIYPEQATGNNPVRCFNWAGEYGDTANLVRGQGENASIISMIDKAIATHGSDPDRVYIVGFSAGAAFTSVMLATYPERFAAGAIMSGLPYRCATSVNGAFSCQSPGVTRTARQWGDLVRAASTFTGTRPRVQIWHGSTDTTVVPANATQLVAQWTDVAGTDTTADETETIGTATRSAYKEGDRVVVEEYRITGMGHATSVGADDGACTARTAAYFVESGVCATRRAAKFFGLTASLGPDGDDGAGDDGAGDDGAGDDGAGDDGAGDDGTGDDGAGDDSGDGNGATDDGAPSSDLPGCSLNAAGTPPGFSFVAVVLAALLLRRRR